jgi:hypothetical protein
MPQRNTPPGEFSGHQQRNTIAPPVTPAGTPGHEPVPHEELRLLYLTGQTEDSTMPPVDGVWEGLQPLEVALAEKPQPRKYFEE